MSPFQLGFCFYVCLLFVSVEKLVVFNIHEHLNEDTQYADQISSHLKGAGDKSHKDQNQLCLVSQYFPSLFVALSPKPISGGGLIHIGALVRI